ncbi:MAG: Ig-like domain-containing protein, partial [bacterium]
MQGTISAALSGTERVRILRNGVDIGEATINADGVSWSFTDAGLASGSSYTYTARVVDAAGNQSADSNSLSFSLNTSGVSQTVQVLDIQDDQVPQTGSVANGGSTNDNTPLISGSVSAALASGDRVEVLRNGVVMGSATVNGTTWSYQDSLQLDGVYSYTARVVNSGGNQGAPSAAYVIALDTAAPTATVSITDYTDDVVPSQGNFGRDTSTNDTSPQINGTLSGPLAEGERVAVFRDGTLVGYASVNNNAWSFQDSGLVNGNSYQYTARVVDRANNLGDLSTPLTLTIDTEAPTATTQITAISEDRGVAGDFVTSDNTLVFTGSNTALVAGERVQISLDDGQTWQDTVAVTGTSWSFDNSANALPDGSYNVRTRVVDAAGNAGPEDVQVVRVDASAPTQSVAITQVLDNVAPEEGAVTNNGFTNDTTPELRGTLSVALG